MRQSTRQLRSLRTLTRLPALALCALLMAPAFAVAQTTVVRTVEYEYDATTGQVIKERIEPGAAECVQTIHTLDTYGNRKLTTVSSCNPGGATFPPRSTHMQYDARTDHPAGAFVTAVRTGKPGLETEPAKIMSRSSARHDPSTGRAIEQTAEGDTANRHLVSRTELDGLGRPLRQFVPVDRDSAGTLINTYAQSLRVYCQGSLQTQVAAERAACLNITTLPSVTVDYSSRLNTNSSGLPSSTVQPEIITAYYIQTQSFDAGGQAASPPSRTHYDSLHRVVAKEARHFNGRWVMELTAYDELGLPVAGWSGFFGRQVDGTFVQPADIDEHRQWTAAFDLLHRPTDQRNYWRGELNGALATRRVEHTYRGLELLSTIPGDSSPDGSPRTSTTRKDPMDRPLQTVDAYGATLSMAYDAVGNLLQTQDAMGNVTQLTYSGTHARFKTSMVDPSVGSWTYTYDGLGQLLTQTDARGNPTTLGYDELGRLVSKSNPDLKSAWFYDRDAAGNPCASGHNRICEVASGGEPTNPSVPRVAHYRYTYDSLARSAQQTLSTGDRSYTTSVGYDGQGRVATQTYPTGFAVRHTYAGATDFVPGALLQVADASNSQRVFWRVDTLTRDTVFNARGQLLRAQLGNGLLLDHTLDPVSGKAFVLRAGPSGSNPTALDHRYRYDQVGNVVARMEALMGVNDTFTYDRLNRLTQHQLGSASDAAATRTVTLTYNALGSILSKDDVGGYRYNAAGSPQPFAVQGVGGSEYRYDENGQLTTVTGVQQRSHQWTAFNQPSRMSYGSNTVAFLYDGDYKRLREDFFAAEVLQRRVFQLHPDKAGGLGYEREEVFGSQPRTEHRHFIRAGAETIAVVKTLGEGAAAGAVQSDANLVLYWHKDALGSIVAVSNANGDVLERMSFDPWGKRQASSGGTLPLTASAAHGDRGFTGHEHLDELALVHMNGRVYDPLLARFFSADPLIQDPSLLQNYNRYSYGLNNPLMYTDPTGESWEVQIAMFVVGLVLAHEGNQYWSMAGRIMMMVALSGAGTDGGGLVEMGLGTQSSTFAAGGTGNAMLSAGIATAVSPGASFESVTQSMVFAAAFNVVGGNSVVSTDQGRLMAHALIGCVQGAVSGGKCGPSALAAFAGKAFSNATAGMGIDPYTRGVLTMVAGGTTSVIGGGKFTSGAAQAGFAYLFNALSSLSNAQRGQLVSAGAFLGGTTGVLLAGGCTATTGGACSLGAPTIVAGGLTIGAATGSAIADAVDGAITLINGNSWLSPKATSVYQLVSNVDQSVLKYGITGRDDPTNRYSAAMYQILDMRMEVIATFESRAPARMLEFMLCTGHVVEHKKLPPLSDRC